jgi:hypothetical protein
MRVAPGASLDHVSVELMRGICVVEEEFQKAGLEARITSAFRPGSWAICLLHGTARPPSRAHRTGLVDACDFSYPPPEKAAEIISAITKRLSKKHGGAFDVLDEKTAASATAAGVGSQWTGQHIHLEFDP